MRLGPAGKYRIAAVTIKQRSLPDSPPSLVRLTSLALRWFVVTSKFLDERKKKKRRKCIELRSKHETFKSSCIELNLGTRGFRSLGTLKIFEFWNIPSFRTIRIPKFPEMSGFLKCLDPPISRTVKYPNFQTHVCEILEFKILNFWMFDTLKLPNSRMLDFSEHSKI